MVGIRHSVATATAFLKTTLPVKEGRFRFISRKLAEVNSFEQMLNTQIIYQKFN